MKIVWIILILLLGLILFGTGESITVSPPSTATMVEINGNPGVILDASEYRPDAEGWTAGIDDLQAAEDAVLTAPAGWQEPQLDGYRQYVAIIEEGDRKIIVNSMCTEFDGWTETYIEIADGGPCFWNALYNIDTGELEYLIVNGQA